MPKDFDLTSQRWLNLVFQGRNQEYGAYELRVDSSDRHLKSLIIVAVAGLFLVFLPALIKSVIPKQGDSIDQTQSVVMANFNEAEVPEENQIKEPEHVPPPPELKTTIKLTEAIIKHDEEIQDDDLMMTQDQLKNETAAISIANVEGVEGGTVDIATLIDHKVVTEEPKENKIYDHVEVMPAFPGGESALMKWLRDNIVFPSIAQEQGVSGRVQLRFVVLPDGSIGEVQLLRSLDPNCDKEAITKVKKMPKWIPGKQNGNPVSVWYTLPITFRLEGGR
jgi:protein TonB